MPDSDDSFDEHDPDEPSQAKMEGKPVARSRWFVLVETAGSYGVRSREGASTDPPLANFGEGEKGFVAADEYYRRRTRQMRLFAQLPEILAWIVGVGAVTWMLTDTILYVWRIGWFTPGSSSGLPVWIDGASQISYSLWLGALGLMGMLWLLRRFRESPPDA